ncbi:MAG: DUF6288 domain-containing protein, partial [Planctomycetota bacterium]
MSSILLVLLALAVLEYPLAAQPGPGRNPWGGQGQPGQPGQPGGQGNPWGQGQGQPGGQGMQPGGANNGGGGKLPGSENDYFNLGPIGLMGMPTAEGIEIKIVEKDGRAEKAGLKVGDVITGADGKEFKRGENVIDAYAEAFDKVEESKDAKLELLLAGDRKVEVALKKTGKHSNDGPGDKSEEAFKAACKYLVDKQQTNGSWYTQLGGTNGVVVVTSLAAMVLISSGDKQYQVNIDKAAGFVMAKAGVMNDGFGGDNGGRIRPRQQFDPEALEKMARERMKAQGMSDEEIDREIQKYKDMAKNGQIPGMPGGGGGNNPWGGRNGNNGGGNNNGGSGNPWNGGGNGNPGDNGDNGQGAAPGGSQNPANPGSGSENWDQTNWGLSYGSWFIACWNQNKA